jgi:prepilin-type N-terminal cleavage/methylation domain-containing protein
MRLNNKGFSLIEIMAVLVLTTIILVPLLSGLSDSYNANQRAQHRSNALSIAQGSIFALEKIDFIEYRTQVTASLGGLDYVELNEGNCSDFDSIINEGICDNIFTQIWNNEKYDADTFKIFIFDYKLTGDQYNNIMGEDAVPSEVKDAISENDDITTHLNEDNIETLIRVVVWVQYFENPDRAVTLEGMLVDE